MKVTLQTDAILVVEDRPWAFGLLMIGAIVILAWGSLDNVASDNRGAAIASGLFSAILVSMLPLFIKRVMLTLNRQSQSITLTTRGWWSQTTATYDLRKLKRARITMSTNSDGDKFHAVELILGGTAVPLTNVASGGEEAAQVAQAINGWLPVDSPPQPT